MGLLTWQNFFESNWCWADVKHNPVPLHLHIFAIGEGSFQRGSQFSSFWSDWSPNGPLWKKMKIGTIRRSVTHSFAWLDVLHFERPLLQCEHHKDRKLSLVLDLKPRTTFHFTWKNLLLHFNKKYWTLVGRWIWWRCPFYVLQQLQRCSQVGCNAVSRLFWRLVEFKAAVAFMARPSELQVHAGL